MAVLQMIYSAIAPPSMTSLLMQNSASSQGIIMSKHWVVCDYSHLMMMTMMKRRGLKASLDNNASSSIKANTAEVGRVTLVNIETFLPIVKSAGDKTVVLDMYTQWCSPCKVIAPKYKQLSEKYDDVVFLKLDCNQDNRPLAKELGLKVVPTFKIMKDGKVVKEVTRAKFDNLIAAIENARLSST